MPADWMRVMSRFRLYPTPVQLAALLEQCRHARYMWNLALEQWSMWRRDRGPTPGYVEQARQLTEARAAFGWLRAGSQTVQQQALRDFHQAVAYFYAGTNRRPSWRKAGLHEGFRIVGGQATRVEKLSRRWARVLVPKVGWVKLRLTRAIPAAKSYRVTRDRAGRWHIAAIPQAIPAPGTGEVVGVDRGITVSAALSTGDLLSCPGLSEAEVVRLKWLQRRLVRCRRSSNRRRQVKAAIAKLLACAADRRKDWAEKTSAALAQRFDLIRVEDLRINQMTRRPKPKPLPDPGRPGAYLPNGRRAKAGLNRGILANGWGVLVRRLQEKAPGRVEQVKPAYTSQTCSVCGHRAPENRQSQAVFQCVACGHRANADVNAAVNIAAGRAVSARQETPPWVSPKREPQLTTST